MARLGSVEAILLEKILHRVSRAGIVVEMAEPGSSGNVDPRNHKLSDERSGERRAALLLARKLQQIGRGALDIFWKIEVLL